MRQHRKRNTQVLHVLPAAGLYLRRLASGLDRALANPAADAAASSLAPNPGGAPGAGGIGTGRSAQQPRARTQFVHNMQVVRACPMYGYHSDEQLFIKVSM